MENKKLNPFFFIDLVAAQNKNQLSSLFLFTPFFYLTLKYPRGKEQVPHMCDPLESARIWTLSLTKYLLLSDACE